jgi:hypothetical protein
MFYVKEILSITVISTRENRTCPQGVRFEIRMPSGKSRFLNQGKPDSMKGDRAERLYDLTRTRIINQNTIVLQIGAERVRDRVKK